MKNDKSEEKKSEPTDDYLSIDDWMLVKAITSFKCEHEACAIQVKENDYFLLFLNRFREKNLCIQHGIQKIKKQKKLLEVFETNVMKKVKA